MSPRTAISTTFFVIGCAVAMISVMLPLIRLKFGFDEAVFGTILLAFGCGAVVALPLAHRLQEHFSHALITRYGVFVALGALSVPAMVSSTAILATSLFCAGVALATVDIAMNANAVAVEQSHVAAGRQRMLSSCHGFYSLGGLTGLLFGPLSHLLELEWMAPVGAVILMAVFAIACRHLFIEGPQCAADTNHARPVLNPTLILISIAALIAFTAEGAVIDWSGVYLETVQQAKTSWFGAGFAAFSLSMALMRFVGDGLRTRFGDRSVIVCSLLLSATAYLLISSADSITGTVLGYALLGLGLGNVVPVYFLMATKVPGVKSSAGLSLVVGIGYLGMLTFPPAIGWVAQILSLRTAFLGVAVMLLLSLAVTAVIPRIGHLASGK